MSKGEIEEKVGKSALQDKGGSQQRDVKTN